MTKTVRLGLLVALLAGSLAAEAAEGAIEGITFSEIPGKTFVPMEEATKKLGFWLVRRNRKGGVVIKGKTIPAASLKTLLDGTPLIAIEDFQGTGVRMVKHQGGKRYTLTRGSKGFSVQVDDKRVKINLNTQRLEAWQGNRLVLKTRISSGEHNSTKTGRFRAGPYKSAEHFSSKYENAPMPWSVQINGHIFIHGSTYVPDFPASHGCVRVPLDGGNPAKFFYEWIDRGTPVEVVRD